MDTDFDHATIYNWFDKCGVISNIRTQLRQNLIHALKSKDISLNQTHLRSAKQYIYDLLIAEYLLKTNFAYTLSVFTSEAPLPVNFDQLLTSNPKNVGKLQNDYLQHTLETLGINPQDSKGHFILSEYAKKDESLLICILHCLKLCSFPNKKQNLEEKNEKVKSTYVGRDECTQTYESNSCNRCKHLIHIKKKLVRQKNEFDKLLNEKSEKLKNQAQITEQQLILLQEKMEQMQNLMHTLNTKRKQFAEEKIKEEERVHEKKLELLHKEEFLAKEAKRIEVERMTSKQVEENLEKLRIELRNIKHGLSEEPKQVSKFVPNTIICKESKSVQTDSESFAAEKEILLREKQDLSILAREQQERIHQLTYRAVQLSRQLEEAQLKLNSFQNKPRIPYTSTFISEGSSTDDILQDAKMRLKRLEEESQKAEKRYQDFLSQSQANLLIRDELLKI